MDRAEIVEIAEQLVEEYKAALHVDPFFKISVEIVACDSVSECVQSDRPATWIIKLDPTKHIDIIDVQLSVVSGVLNVLFRDIAPSKHKDEVMSKLTYSVCQLTSSDEEPFDEPTDRMDDLADD